MDTMQNDRIHKTLKWLYDNWDMWYKIWQPNSGCLEPEEYKRTLTALKDAEMFETMLAMIVVQQSEYSIFGIAEKLTIVALMDHWEEASAMVFDYMFSRADHWINIQNRDTSSRTGDRSAWTA